MGYSTVISWSLCTSFIFSIHPSTSTLHVRTYFLHHPAMQVVCTNALSEALSAFVSSGNSCLMSIYACYPRSAMSIVSACVPVYGRALPAIYGTSLVTHVVVRGSMPPLCCVGSRERFWKIVLHWGLRGIWYGRGECIVGLVSLFVLCQSVCFLHYCNLLWTARHISDIPQLHDCNTHVANAQANVKTLLDWINIHW